MDIDTDDDGPPIDPEEQAYYDRLDAVVRPKGMKIEIVYGQEGPAHDPYGWREFRVTFDDGRWATYREALLSEGLVVCTPIGTVEFTSPGYVDEPSMLKMFESFVGFETDQLDFWSNADWWKDEEVRAAESAAGWDASA